MIRVQELLVCHVARLAPLMVVFSLACPAKSVHTVSEQAAAAARLACAYKAGAMASDTLASDAPLGTAIPIDHVVMVIQENHSFDAMFSQLTSGARVAPAGVTNADPDGTLVPRQHQPHLCLNDIGHSWAESHAEYDNGKNDGFASVNYPNATGSMDYYDSTDVPFYYALANAFAISDSHFCSLLGPTSPNRMFSLAATSYGLTYNTVAPLQDSAGTPYPNLFTRLDDAKLTWKYYVDSSPPEGAVFVGIYLNDNSHFFHVSDFVNDAAAGTLPAVSIVEPQTTNYADDQDEHPPADIQIGQQFVASVVQALTTSPNWPTSALFFTYDEHGGFYDSVPPPAACPPDQIAAILQPGDPPGGFDRYGFRVPLIVVSPYAKRSYVSHTVTDHTSVLRFIEARFGLPAMTARDANADPLFDMFDFSHADTTVPQLPGATPDPDDYAYCNGLYPDPG